jgi:hypothetical protein
MRQRTLVDQIRDRATRPQRRRKSVTANQQHQARVLTDSTRLLTSCLRDDAGNPVFELIDRKRTLDALTNIDSLDKQGRVRLYGAATAALWLAARSDVRSPAT